MKRQLLNVFVGVMVVCGSLLQAGTASAITKEEVMTLARLGIPEADIIKAIEKDRTVFELKIQDILELKKAGVPEGAIRFMLATPQKYGKGASAASAASSTAAAPKIEGREKTPEELKAEADRQREDARRQAEEQKKADEARKTAYARGVMKKGLSLAEEGKWVDAVEGFQKFVAEGSYNPGSIEAYNAKYGIATALVKARLYQSAAKMLVEVLLEGPEKPFFKEAFEQLRTLRKEIIYNPPDLEQLTKFFLGNYSLGFQDEVNYVLGEFFYDFGNYQRALKHFESVSEKSPDRAKALYLMGLVQVRYKMYKSAVQSFQKAIDVTEKNKSDPAVTDLSYMALARVAYEAESHDAAIFYYKRVPRESIRAASVFYELAWTYLIKGDYSRALGAFHALHSPYFARTFYPELWILEARVYSDLCRYEEAGKALEMFTNKVAVHLEPLKRFINTQKSPDDFYNNFVATMNDKNVAVALPRQLAYPVLSNVEFTNVYRTVRQIEKEQAEVERYQTRLGKFATEMLTKLAVLRKDRVFESGVKIQQILKDLEGTMTDALVRQTEIEVDINAVAMERMTEETRRMVGEGADNEAAEGTRKEGAIAIVGGDTEFWTFDGDYWFDETPYYRSLLTSQCIQ